MTPVEQWQTALQAFLAYGYSWLNAQEAVHARFPGLWEEAAAQVARETDPGPPVAKTAHARRAPARRWR